MFNKLELEEFKRSLNNLIASRIVYLNSEISKTERRYTEENIKLDYLLLEKVLKLIGKEESKWYGGRYTKIRIIHRGI